MPIIWKKEFDTGIEKIDSQHKKLVNLINLLEAAKDKENEDQIVHDVFFELVEYTKIHFADEEKYMESLNYPRIIEHKALHKVLIKQLCRLLNMLKKGNINVGERLTSILNNWLIKHILDHDLEYSQQNRFYTRSADELLRLSKG